MNFELDNLDKNILKELQKDFRKPFQEIARDLGVSGGTVHVRYSKMKEEGYIKGGHLALDPEKLGYTVCAFVGINLHNAKDVGMVVDKIKKMPRIIEAHYTTGVYSLFIKIVAKNLPGLHRFLAEKLQVIPEIRSTETLISLDVLLDRDVTFPED